LLKYILLQGEGGGEKRFCLRRESQNLIFFAVVDLERKGGHPLNCRGVFSLLGFVCEQSRCCPSHVGGNMLATKSRSRDAKNNYTYLSLRK